MTPGQAVSRAVWPERQRRLKQCGVSLCAGAAMTAQHGTGSARLHGQLVELVRTGIPVALRITGLCGGTAVHDFYRTCLGLGTAFSRAGIDPRVLELTIDAAAMPLPAAWNIRRAILGNGILNVMFDAISAGSVSPANRSNAFWQDLWRLRSAPVRSAFCPDVRSACKLLSPEQGTGVVPVVGLQAPEQSAWLRAELNLTLLADAGGDIDTPTLATAIAKIMDEADSVYDTASWATSKMQHDGWYNHRLAIVPVGIGGVAKLRGLDPERHASLAELRKLLATVRRLAEAQSRTRARHHERLPSIAASNPCLHLPAGARESCWQRHWHAALERHALRHRNLIVLSPWSLFPSGDADFQYANFLPLLAEADACEFERGLSLDSWTVPQLKLFHCRAWALNNAVPSTAVIADQS